MEFKNDTKLYVLPDGTFITLADIWLTEREQIVKNQEDAKKWNEHLKDWKEIADKLDTMPKTTKEKTDILSDVMHLAFGGGWYGHMEEFHWDIAKCVEALEKIKERLFKETGQTNYITAYDLKQILDE